MNGHFDDKPLLNYLFDSSLPLSFDLQRLISDYLYYREVIPFTKQGIPSWLRFGPTLIDNKLAYEIRAYNEVAFHVFSTFSIKAETLAYLVFGDMKPQITINWRTDWSNVFFTCMLDLCGRYVYSPLTDLTYSVRAEGSRNHYDLRIVNFEGKQIHYIGETDDLDIAKSFIRTYCNFIEKQGEYWKNKV
jgi:hypothetical protein